MIRVAIVEDEAGCAEQLRQYLEDYGKEYHQEMETTVYPHGQALLDSYRSQFDLLLLDIEMPHVDGMTTAQRIRQRDPEVIIMFITNMGQYAIRGYEVDALDYILKPVSYFFFSQRLNRAVSRIRSHSTHYIVVPIKGGSKKLDTDTIYFVESRGHTLVVHAGSGEYTLNGTMKEIEQRLSGLHFFRCNKGYLVSLQHVDSIQDGCAIVGGQRLLISRGRKNEFMEALTNYMGEVML